MWRPWRSLGERRRQGPNAEKKKTRIAPSNNRLTPLSLFCSRVIILVKAGAPVDATIDGLKQHMEAGDIIIDGGNEWYENTERRAAALAPTGIRYLGMGVSGGEEGARNGPSMMPGGDRGAYDAVAPILAKVAAQVDDGPCAMYVGPGGAGNYVKMVHNGIEYGDMQLISEAYDILKTVGGLTNAELAAAFTSWNEGDLSSFLVQITAIILAKKDEVGGGDLIDVVLDKTGMKGTGKWTVQQAADLSVAAPTIEASLDARFLSGLKDERVAAAAFYEKVGVAQPSASSSSGVDKAELVSKVRAALYASKICSYAQGMNIIRAKSEAQGWGVDLAALARIWKGGCIIRAAFLDDIRAAYARDPALASLLVDPFFGQAVADRQAAWRDVVALVRIGELFLLLLLPVLVRKEKNSRSLFILLNKKTKKQAVKSGVAAPGMTSSLAYFDTYRRARLPANLVQAQRDYFG